ncbi:hypothetical protein MSMAW_3013 [Methanosarcina mazei WWM610]|uniref:Uncharacterized protein n=2 Tax=Methanosarcina mazei TaxID=2209 RepID=A0A0E3Q1M2_METMZ|nr:hypothetical protein MSMAW_3013 [Methanosarcina mazei WWM610]AKB73001.1 hypothetical protein MSMAC_3111 [Methanosarcina mazei C16]
MFCLENSLLFVSIFDVFLIFSLLRIFNIFFYYEPFTSFSLFPVIILLTYSPYLFPLLIHLIILAFEALNTA